MTRKPEVIMLSLEEYIAKFGHIQAGPCTGCGATDYRLSMGGPGICPACDCLPPEQRVRELAEENRVLRARIAELMESGANESHTGTGEDPAALQ